jgi:hypothetical protein
MRRDRTAHRRWFLTAIGALGLAGLAGCVGDDDTQTDDGAGSGNGGTPTDDGIETTVGTTDTPPDTETPTDTPPDTETPTDTPTSTPGLPDDPAPLLSVSEGQRVTPGETITVSGVVQNPYLFDLTAGELVLEPPGEDWSVTPVEGTTFETLPVGESVSVAWDVTAPASVEGEFTLTVGVTYTGGDDQADVATGVPLLVKAPIAAPYGIDFGGAHTEEAVTIDGVEFRPGPEAAASIDIAENRPLEPGEFWWDENVTMDPVPNCSHSTLPEYTDDAPDAFENTTNSELYRGEYWLSGGFTIEFTIENGTYDVDLHLAEWFVTEPGERIVDVTVNEETVVDGVDLIGDIGFGVAETRTATGVEVTNNTLVVTVQSSPAPAKLNGMAIRDA